MHTAGALPLAVATRGSPRKWLASSEQTCAVRGAGLGRAVSSPRASCAANHLSLPNGEAISSWRGSRSSTALECCVYSLSAAPHQACQKLKYRHASTTAKPCPSGSESESIDGEYCSEASADEDGSRRLSPTSFMSLGGRCAMPMGSWERNRRSSCHDLLRSTVWAAYCVAQEFTLYIDHRVPSREIAPRCGRGVLETMYF